MNNDFDEIIKDMNDYDEIIKNMNEMGFINTLENKAKQRVREHRDDIILMLQLMRENMLMDSLMPSHISEEVKVKKEDIEMAVKISELIKLMTEESLRDKEAGEWENKH